MIRFALDNVVVSSSSSDSESEDDASDPSSDRTSARVSSISIGAFFLGFDWTLELRSFRFVFRLCHVLVIGCWKRVSWVGNIPLNSKLRTLLL